MKSISTGGYLCAASLFARTGLVLFPLACASNPSTASMTVASDTSLPSSPVSRFFPLVEGPIWAYDAGSDEDPTKKGMFVTRVRRLAGARFALVSGNGEHTLEARADGIVQTESGTYVLKAPLAVGASWPGEHGVVRVSALDKVVEV